MEISAAPSRRQRRLGNVYFLLLVDDMSHFMWLTLLRSKADAPAAIQAFQARVERETGKKLKVLRTDNGGEFTSVEFGEYCAGEGIQRHHSAPYTPQQNGIVERRNQTMMATARSILRARRVPELYQGTSGVRRCTALCSYSTGHPPLRSMGRPRTRRGTGRNLLYIGCVAYIKQVCPHLAKLDDRGIKVVFIGYQDGTKAYMFFDPEAARVYVSRDTVFDEDARWNWEDTLGADDRLPFTIEEDHEVRTRHAQSRFSVVVADCVYHTRGFFLSHECALDVIPGPEHDTG
jgi:hypothetical protein